LNWIRRLALIHCHHRARQLVEEDVNPFPGRQADRPTNERAVRGTHSHGSRAAIKFHRADKHSGKKLPPLANKPSFQIVSGMAGN
jgi:hypothetical protein